MSSSKTTTTSTSEVTCPVVDSKERQLNQVQENKEEKETVTAIVPSSTAGQAADDNLVDKELEDKLTELDKSSTSGDSDVKWKSATLTPSSSSSETQSSVNPQGNGAKGSLNPHGFSTITRNNLRRSFTLPRGLLARKSGQTGPVSENQNGSFMKNIFLTLVRTKSVRKTKSDSTKDTKDEDVTCRNSDQAKLTNGTIIANCDI